MEFGVLGPLLIRDETGALSANVVRAAKQRILLAALLLRAGRVVSVDYLVETLWDGLPPETALPSLRNYVARLRTALGTAAGSRISFRDKGYVIEVSEDEVDLLRFTGLLEGGSAAFQRGEFALAAELTGRALEQWRGPVLEDVASDALHREECVLVAERRLDAVELKLEADRRLGIRPVRTAELRDLAWAHPERELLWEHLINGLRQGGRRIEALAEFRRLERVLGAEYGVRPGARIRRLISDIHPADAAHRDHREYREHRERREPSKSYDKYYEFRPLARASTRSRSGSDAGCSDL